ncbi:MAG TPA: septal ring lytic transglycosylase RlpA family protein [Actinomycetota bacterium]|nr:septal ring lytic transglycosylase RlpA family protein [Actinomycetota bacterium]
MARLRRVFFCAATVALALGPLILPAGAADLAALQAGAQEIADRVTALEHELASLNSQSGKLERKIAEASQEIGLLELELHDIEAAHAAAESLFIERAVEAYKNASTDQISLLLSATDMTQLMTLEKAMRESAETDAESLDRFLEARKSALATQAQVDERKQELLLARTRVENIRGHVAAALQERRERLRELTRRIEHLEEQARAAAAAAAVPSDELLRLLRPAGPAPGIPDGFVGTGVSFEGIASWYGPGFEGNPTASGQIFDSSLYTAASKELPLGSWLYVVHEGKGVVVLVNDRGPYVEGRILDLSAAAAEAIGIGGLGWIEAEILIKE